MGIGNTCQLKSIGAENNFIRLKALDNKACIIMLCATDSAIQGIRWHHPDESRKAELKEFFKMTKY